MRFGSRVADVGCDHGKLSAWLILSGRAGGVIASDIRPGPLARAAALFKVCNIDDQIRLVLCDGLAGIKPDEVDDILIAGVGFETIVGMIAAAPWLKDPDKRLVLVPASRHAKLRAWLGREGFEILEETPVAEAGHYYTVMTAQYTGRTVELGSVAAALGAIMPDTADGRNYITQVYRTQHRIANGKAPEEKRRAARKILAYIESEYEIND